MPRLPSLAALVLLAGLPLAGTSLAGSDGDPGISLTILPPGQNGTLTLNDAVAFLTSGILPAHVDDQREMYAALGRASPGLEDAALPDYFKPAPLGPAEAPESVVTPRSGVTIVRDAYGVPHVSGGRSIDVMYGIGYATARDRLFFMDVARHEARGRLTEFLSPFRGLSPTLIDFALELDRGTYGFAGYSEREFRQQFDDLAVRFGREGRRVQEEIGAFVEGVNAYIESVSGNGELQPAEYLLLGSIEPWTVTDVVAIATQIEVIFGAGGGAEHRNALLLQALRGRFGQQEGTALFRDLRQAEDPETPVTTEGRFPYLVPGRVDPAAVALPDPGSILEEPAVVVSAPETVAALPPPSGASGGLAAIGALAGARRGRTTSSNFLVVTRQYAAGGHPVAVMGPQTGYFAPEALMEIGYEGGDLAARGALPPGFPYVILGRGLHHAWSPTSGNSDTIDVRAERLCEPDGSAPTRESSHYLFENVCSPIQERVDRWCVGVCPEGETNARATVRRTVHGVVFARARVGGVPVVLVRQRASFGREIDAAVAYRRANRRSLDARRFERAMGVNPASFNWAYLDHRDVAYFHSGLYPRRAPGVDPELPSWGTGEWEWEGFLRRSEQPGDRNPARGFLSSWNNKPAREWRAADDNYGFGPVQRVQSLDERLEAAIASGRPITAARLVEIMADAGQVDLRGSQVLPWALELLAPLAQDAPELAPALEALGEWLEAGAPRRDRDGDGEYEHAGAVALMDAWYQPMIQATLGPQLEEFFDLIPIPFDDPPNPLGSAYQSGYYGYLQKTFRMALGRPVSSPFEVLHCADGTAPGCGAALAESLEDAVALLTVLFRSADPADWRVDPTSEQIEFQPFGLFQVDPIPWVNRPTFQQVIQLEGGGKPGSSR